MPKEPRLRGSGKKEIPDDVKKAVEDLVQRFNARAKGDPECVYVARYKAKFLYLDRRDYGRLQPICRLGYTGNILKWSFAIYKYSDGTYDADEFFPGDAHVDGTIEGAMKAGLEAYPA